MLGPAGSGGKCLTSESSSLPSVARLANGNAVCLRLIRGVRRRMNPDPAAGYFPYYFAVWAMLAIFSWLWIRTRPTPCEKKRWSDRVTVLSSVFVTSFICFVLVLWKQYAAIPIFIAAGALIVFLNLRNSFYCDNCGKESQARSFSSSFHCRHCGHKLR